MRAVLQKVKWAKVEVGISKDDLEEDINYMVNRILGVRVFDDEKQMWKKSVKDMNLEVLCGNKPDFHRAMGSEKAEEFFNMFIEKLKKSYSDDKIQTGEFGAMMDVSLCNDGPVTLELDSRKYEYIGDRKSDEKKHS
ncbi:D-tyrosyl-tRNA(Tyr) deacylase 1 [Zancudomyces culisetae]|uniref:D-aminoacyl-tRNA deacylase n=1 Tax=Zancudomyces culisetae TaxID=1213189 RepID=A0A1R1PZG0_ZANCU|nr:D-tyrosyl-tRNA(Tyr) deacylase 1 [Zancudomyces culisetae]|eukprot:OMH86334.1 D-tyrosyl-tRNA(Tyr) deacylase 1 [Zancudomyces culisetae]